MDKRRDHRSGGRDGWSNQYGNQEKRLFGSTGGGYGRPERYNRFSEYDNRYGLNYDSGRGRFNADYGGGYANTNRSQDRDWDNGRNIYWRERYHHQGHEEEEGPISRLGDKIKDTWTEWLYGVDEKDRNSHRRGYSSNFRDEGWEL
jgi:hypothetical protein